tara:strand:+ start:1980 stop:2888 length:909 start_codon:yes stop_codon:yes gene_type:complete
MTRSTRLTATLAAGLLFAAAAQAETIEIQGGDALNLVTVMHGVTYETIPGGFSRTSLEMDLLLPASREPVPVIVFAMGNGWRSIDRGVLLAQLAPIAQAGFAIASIDYRIIGEATFPEPQRDVNAAVRFLRANADRFNIDPERVGLFGSSAGAHLVLNVGLAGGEELFENDAWADQSSAVDAIAVFYPPVYMTQQNPDPAYLANLHLGAVGADPANAELAAQATPATYIDANDPPVMLIHGTEDPVVPIDQSEQLHDALEAAGVDVTFLRVNGIGHSFGRMSSTPGVYERLIAFYDEHLRGE